MFVAEPRVLQPFENDRELNTPAQSVHKNRRFLPTHDPLGDERIAQPNPGRFSVGSYTLATARLICVRLAVAGKGHREMVRFSSADRAKIENKSTPALDFALIVTPPCAACPAAASQDS